MNPRPGNSPRTYMTKRDAIEEEIIAPIESTGDVVSARIEFDVDAIAELALSGYDEAYTPLLGHDEFWRVVEEHRIANSTEEIVTIDEDLAYSGPLQRKCPSCASPMGVSCTVEDEPHEGDVRDLHTVRRQILGFHAARVASTDKRGY